jgi:putative tricarboxylic transport membrane protein
MRSRLDPGEVILALLFSALGLLWIVAALGMPFWEGFAPQSGFVPFWYGAILVGLSAAIVVNLVRRKGEAGEEKEPIGKPLIVLGALAAGIVGLEIMGFAPAVFLLLLVLFAVVERLPVMRSVIVAAATTAVLLLLFRTWLGIPLPTGPLGI